MQPIQGVPPHPASEPPDTPPAETQSLSTQQRTVLERLVTRIVAQGTQQSAEVWAALRHSLNINRDGELQSHHFPAAEKLLQQRLETTRSSQNERQILAQLTILLGQGNNRQAVSDYIRQQFGHTALSQLTPSQQAEVLHLLQDDKLIIPQPQLRAQTDRPLLPAEHNTLNQAVIKLAAATGEPARRIWQSLLELTGVKDGELIVARHYAPLTTWLSARLTLAGFSEVTVRQLQSALRQPLDKNEWQSLIDSRKDPTPLTPHSILNQVQVQELLNQLVLMRTGQPITALQPRHIQPVWKPIESGYRAIASRRGAALFTLILVLLIVGWWWIAG